MNKKVFFLAICFVISLGILVAVIIGSRKENQFAATMPAWRTRMTTTRPRPPQTTTPTTGPSRPTLPKPTYPRPTLPQHVPTVSRDMQIENNDLPLGSPNEIVDEYTVTEATPRDSDLKISPYSLEAGIVPSPSPSITWRGKVTTTTSTTVPGMPGIGFGWIYQICCMYSLPCCKK